MPETPRTLLGEVLCWLIPAPPPPEEAQEFLVRGNMTPEHQEYDLFFGWMQIPAGGELQIDRARKEWVAAPSKTLYAGVCFRLEAGGPEWCGCTLGAWLVTNGGLMACGRCGGLSPHYHKPGDRLVWGSIDYSPEIPLEREMAQKRKVWAYEKIKRAADWASAWKAAQDFLADVG